jgi:hypothetical protein
MEVMKVGRSMPLFAVLFGLGGMSSPKPTILELTNGLALNKHNSSKAYAAVIDAGSTGTRMNIYAFRVPGNFIEMHYFDRLKPGLSALNEKDIESQVEELIERSEEYLKTRGVKIEDVPMVFQATAGMRLLNKDEAERRLGVVKHVLSNHNISYKEVCTIDGTSEGLYALESLKYLKEYEYEVVCRMGCVSGIGCESCKDVDLARISHDKLYGIIDMGGGSTQVAYDLKGNYDSPEIIKVGEKKVLAHSNLGYGLVEAMKKVDSGEDKCNTEEDCKRIFKTIFKEDNLPEINSVDEMYLTSFLFDKLRKLGLPSRTSLKHIIDRYSSHCAGPRNRFCKEVYYIIALLQRYGISEDRKIVLASNVGGVNLNWSVARALSLIDG